MYQQPPKMPLLASTSVATLLVNDGETALIAGLRSYGKAGTGPDCGVQPGGPPFAKRCEWHLRKNALTALKKADGRTSTPRCACS